MLVYECSFRSGSKHRQPMVSTASGLTLTRSGVVIPQNQSRSTGGFKKNAHGTR